MSFEENIQERVRLDNQLKAYNEKIKEIKERRSRIASSIFGDDYDERLCNKTVQISDGRLKFVNTRTANPLTFRYVEASLSNIIRNEEQVAKIVKYLKENREMKTTPEIKRYS